MAVQEVTRRNDSAEVRVRSLASPRVCGRQGVIEAGFLSEYFGFSLSQSSNHCFVLVSHLQMTDAL